MCETIKLFFEGRLTEWLSAVGGLVSAIIAFKLFALEKKLKEQESPKVSIWYDSTLQTLDDLHGELTLINLGKDSLPIKGLDLLYGNPESRIKSWLLDKDQVINLPSVSDDSFLDRQSDLILKSHEVFRLILKSKDWPSQFKIRAMYYDGSFEFLDIDTSVLGGKYILTGKGKKYGNS